MSEALWDWNDVDEGRTLDAGKELDDSLPWCRKGVKALGVFLMLL